MGNILIVDFLKRFMTSFAITSIPALVELFLDFRVGKVGQAVIYLGLLAKDLVQTEKNGVFLGLVKLR
jgi:hypothetical protein